MERGGTWLWQLGVSGVYLLVERSGTVLWNCVHGWSSVVVVGVVVIGVVILGVVVVGVVIVVREFVSSVEVLTVCDSVTLTLCSCIRKVFFRVIYGEGIFTCVQRLFSIFF